MMSSLTLCISLITVLLEINSVCCFPLSVASCGLGRQDRFRRNADPNAEDGNPEKLFWACKPEFGASCSFKMPVTISVRTYWHKKQKISESKQRELIMEAATKWEKVTKLLRFEWAPPGVEGDIVVVFAFLDGAHGSLGRAANPSPQTTSPTIVRIDDAENWVSHDHPDRAKEEYSLKWVLLHELGHAIGLGHSQSRGDIMFNEVQSTQAILNAGDIIAVQKFYGDFSQVPPRAPAPPPPPPPQFISSSIHMGGQSSNHIPTIERVEIKGTGHTRLNVLPNNGVIVNNLSEQTSQSVPSAPGSQQVSRQSSERRGQILNFPPHSPTEEIPTRSRQAQENQKRKQRRQRKCNNKIGSCKSASRNQRKVTPKRKKAVKSTQATQKSKNSRKTNKMAKNLTRKKN